jgi:hypothetical protein
MDSHLSRPRVHPRHRVLHRLEGQRLQLSATRVDPRTVRLYFVCPVLWCICDHKSRDLLTVRRDDTYP